MSVFKNSFSRALSVVKSDNANIPYPNPIISGQNTGVNTGYLTDDTANFVSDNVKPGDIVYMLDGTPAAATVLEVINQNNILLNADIFTSSGVSYIVYQNSSQTTNGNDGCCLFVGEAGTLTVSTIGGDVVTFSNISSGTILNVQVNKVYSSSTANSIVALW